VRNLARSVAFFDVIADVAVLYRLGRDEQPGVGAPVKRAGGDPGGGKDQGTLGGPTLAERFFGRTLPRPGQRPGQQPGERPDGPGRAWRLFSAKRRGTGGSGGGVIGVEPASLIGELSPPNEGIDESLNAEDDGPGATVTLEV